jgi:Ca2+-binding RTX toxin-like protein
MTSFVGTSGDDRFGGSSGPDTYDLTLGGEDTINGREGDDSVDMGGALDAGDQVNGGAGSDALNLDGDYSAGLVLTSRTVRNIETINLAGGHDYDLTVSDGTLTGLSVLTIRANGVKGDHLTLDASALALGHSIAVYATDEVASVAGGAGDDSVYAFGKGQVDFEGGGGRDFLFMFRAITRADHFDGGPTDEADSLDLNVGSTIRFANDAMSQIRQLSLRGGDYDLTMADGNLAAGQSMTVFANNLSGGNFSRFDAHAERDGHYEYFGAVEADTVIGGQGGDGLYGFDGDDLLTGARGADLLTGGNGADHFIYLATTDSNARSGIDHIADLQAGDVIDLSAVDSNSKRAGDQRFHLVEAFTHHLGELTLSYDSDADLTTLAGDVNGDGVADLEIHINGDATGFGGLVL